MTRSSNPRARSRPAMAMAGLALTVALAGSIAAAAQAPAPAGQPSPPPASQQVSPPKAILEGACTSCHGVDFIGERRKTRDGWDFTVHRMMDKGADLSVDEVDVLVDYLAKTYPAEAKPAPAPG